jgi:hypothetical protein
MATAKASVEIVLGAWLVLTIVKQAGAWFPNLLLWLRYDVLQLLPGWTFFAPNPAVSEMRFFVRLRGSVPGQNYGDWLEPYLLRSKAGTLPRCLFHPRRRVAKELADTADSLRAGAACSTDVAGLHAICAQVANAHGATAWEFVLAEGNRGSGGVEAVVLSDSRTLNEDVHANPRSCREHTDRRRRTPMETD